MLLASLRSGAIATYPPNPEDRPVPREALETARVALFSGRPDQAYRLLLLAQPELGRDPAWLDLAARIYLALDRPLRQAECYADLGAKSQEPLAKVVAILERQGIRSGPPAFSPAARAWPNLDRQLLKTVQAVAPAKDGGAYLLAGGALVRIGPDGSTLSSRPLSDPLDLSLDESGRPVVLTEHQLLWGETEVSLPRGMYRPASACASPDGNLLLLDRGSKRLYRITPEGTLGGSIAVALGEPGKVRTDPAGRIYLTDRDSSTVHLFGPDMTPIRVVDPREAGRPVRRLEDLFVDFAGDLLLLDASAHQLVFINSGGRLVAASGERCGRVDAAGWDGLSNLLVLNRREPDLRRVAP
jgi:hypothetical protein